MCGEVRDGEMRGERSMGSYGRCIMGCEKRGK